MDETRVVELLREYGEQKVALLRESQRTPDCLRFSDWAEYLEDPDASRWRFDPHIRHCPYCQHVRRALSTFPDKETRRTFWTYILQPKYAFAAALIVLLVPVILLAYLTQPSLTGYFTGAGMTVSSLPDETMATGDNPPEFAVSLSLWSLPGLEAAPGVTLQHLLPGEQPAEVLMGPEPHEATTVTQPKTDRATVGSPPVQELTPDKALTSKPVSGDLIRLEVFVDRDLFLNSFWLTPKGEIIRLAKEAISLGTHFFPSSSGYHRLGIYPGTEVLVFLGTPSPLSEQEDEDLWDILREKIPLTSQKFDATWWYVPLNGRWYSSGTPAENPPPALREIPGLIARRVRSALIHVIAIPHA